MGRSQQLAKEVVEFVASNNIRQVKKKVVYIVVDEEEDREVAILEKILKVEHQMDSAQRVTGRKILSDTDEG